MNNVQETNVQENKIQAISKTLFTAEDRINWAAFATVSSQTVEEKLATLPPPRGGVNWALLFNAKVRENPQPEF